MTPGWQKSSLQVKNVNNMRARSTGLELWREFKKRKIPQALHWEIICMPRCTFKDFCFVWWSWALIPLELGTGCTLSTIFPFWHPQIKLSFEIQPWNMLCSPQNLKSQNVDASCLPAWRSELDSSMSYVSTDSPWFSLYGPFENNCLPTNWQRSWW